MSNIRPVFQKSKIVSCTNSALSKADLLFLRKEFKKKINHILNAFISVYLDLENSIFQRKLPYTFLIGPVLS